MKNEFSHEYEETNNEHFQNLENEFITEVKHLLADVRFECDTFCAIPFYVKRVFELIEDAPDTEIQIEFLAEDFVKEILKLKEEHFHFRPILDEIYFDVFDNGDVVIRMNTLMNTKAMYERQMSEIEADFQEGEKVNEIQH